MASLVPWLLWLCLTQARPLRADFTARCPQPCECKWQSGNKAAACARAGLDRVPHHLSSDIQNLDLSDNPLRLLPPSAFKRAALNNLKKLVLRECLLESVAESAFGGLGIMIELDLSRNSIRALRPNTFRETEKLRRINLSHNLLERLDDGLFRGLQFLQRVEISDNRLTRVAPAAFRDLPRLQILRLDSNNLTRLRPEALTTLAFLSSLELHNNPWRCDCNLQPFRDWAIGRNLYTPPTACTDPPALRGRLWNELDSANFACRPTILEPMAAATLRTRDENVTLSCKVVGNPSPELSWRFNSRPLDASERRYAFSDGSIDLIRWLNVTIVRARLADRGNYTCVAENAGGRDERNVTLVLMRYGGDTGPLRGDALAVLFGCASAALIAFAALATACYCLARRRSGKRLLKSDPHSPNGDTRVESGTTELDKSGAESSTVVGGDVNPVCKPPRRYDAPALTSEATEMAELNRNLLDADSARVSTESGSGERRESAALAHGLSRELLLERRDSNYPPDLLSFPPRLSAAHATTTSPARSPGAASVTLGAGYARFQSPLAPPLPRYVTLPRHPRGPTWSDAPSVTSLSYYDNLGVRISADGGSYLPLNRSEAELPAVVTDEEAPSPAPGTPHTAPPRPSASSPNIHHQLLALHAITATSLALQHAYARRVSPSAVASNTAAQERTDVIRMTGGMDVGLPNASATSNALTVSRRRVPIKKEPLFLESSGEKATQV